MRIYDIIVLLSDHVDNYDIIVYNIDRYKKGIIHMTRLFVYTAPFRSNWKAMGLDDSDLVSLE